MKPETRARKAPVRFTHDSSHKVGADYWAKAKPARTARQRKEQLAQWDTAMQRCSLLPGVLDLSAGEAKEARVWESDSALPIPNDVALELQTWAFEQLPEVRVEGCGAPALTRTVAGRQTPG